MTTCTTTEMRAPAKRRAKPSAALMASCAVALALAVQPQASLAQAFQGTPNVRAGSASVTEAPGITDVFVFSPETVIDWTPSDRGGTGSIDFLPAGTVATFRDGGSMPEYTVLNRILPLDESGFPTARMIELNGQVASLFGNGPGGNIFFFSPTGIVVGPNAVFNVGSLVLTTSDIQFTPADNSGPGSIYGPGGVIRFRGAPDSTGSVTILPGAQINAAGPTAYVGVVATRVVQGGTVEADGPIAYVGAEQVDLTYNAGLFGISILAGTTDANGVVHTGTTTGPASAGATDPRQITLAALPKATMLTMLLSGSIGYTPAVSAFDDGGAVVLSAGFDRDVPIGPPTNALGNIEIGNADFLNRVSGFASNTLSLAPTGGTLQFGAGVSLVAGQAIDLVADNGEAIRAAADFYAQAAEPGIGGRVSLSTAGSGLIDVAGVMSLNATNDSYFGNAGGGGGAISLVADGGTIRALDFDIAVSGSGSDDPLVGGSGTGGTIDLTVRNGGRMEAGFVDLAARGRGGSGDDQGGDGTGGTITMSDLGGTFDLDTLFLDAGGSGGDSLGVAGDGLGGTATVSLAAGSHAWTYAGLIASGTSGFGLDVGSISGNATGGSAALSVSGDASLQLSSYLSLNANAFAAPGGQVGSFGQAGSVSLDVTGGLLDSPEIYLHASAFTDAGSDSSGQIDFTPNLWGGDIAVSVAGGGRLRSGLLDVQALGVGAGAAVWSGQARGGSATLAIRSGADVQLGDGTSPVPLVLSGDGFNGPGPAPSEARGGTATLIIEDGSLAVQGSIEVTASGRGAPLYSPPLPGPGFEAFGGSAGVELRAGASGTASLVADRLVVEAIGDSRAMLYDFQTGTVQEIAIEGDAALGRGGSATLTLDEGSVQVAGAVVVDAGGRGGSSLPSSGTGAFRSGRADGGGSLMLVRGGSLTAGQVQVLSNARAGGMAGAAVDGQLAALPGEANGGSARLGLSGSGSIATTDLFIEGNAFGSPGMNHDGAGAGGDGGTGSAGFATLNSLAGWTGSLSAGNVSIVSLGHGGHGGLSAGGTSGVGGNGDRGGARADLADGSFTLGNVVLDASAFGGSGRIGGTGEAGYADFALIDSAAGPSGPRRIGNLTLNGSGQGGVGTEANGQSLAGEADLDVTVANAADALAITGDLALFSVGDADTGSGVDIGLSGAPLDVGGNVSVSSVRTLTLRGDRGLGAVGDMALHAGGVDSFISLEAGGTLELLTTQDAIAVNGNLTAGDWVFAQSTRGARIGNIVAGNDAAVSAQAGNLTVGTVTAGDEIWLSVLGTDANRTLVAGNLESTGLGNDASDGPPSLFGGAGPTGNVVQVRSAGSLTTGTVLTPGRAILVADGGALSAGSINAPEAALILARNDVALADVSTNGKFYVADSSMIASLPTAYDPASLNGLAPTATSGGLTITGSASAGEVVVAVGDGATLNALASNSTTSILAAGGALQVSDLVSAGAVTAEARSVEIAGSAGLSFANAAATAGDLTIRTIGNLDLVQAGASGVTDLRSRAGDVHATGSISGGRIELVAGRNVVADAALRSTGELRIDAGGTFSLAGVGSGTAIRVDSSDVVLAPTAKLGERGTTATITLLNRNSAQGLVLGGDGSGSGYRISAAELALLSADDRIEISTGGDVSVRDFALTFGAQGNLGTGGTLKLLSPARIEITGAVELTTTSQSDTFAIDPTRIDVIAGEGSIRMLSGSAVPQGTLELQADTVAVATQSTLDAISSADDRGQIAELLASPAPAGPLGGYLQAGTIRITAQDGLFIQNAGPSEDFDDRRGFSAEALEIVTGSASTLISINGQILANGAPITGQETVGRVTINGQPAAAGGQFDPLSNINGCTIGAVCGAGPDPLLPHLAPTPGDELEFVGSAEPGDDPFVARRLISLEQNEPLITPPPVDEPITGIGNDDLWEAACEGEDGQSCQEEGVAE